jgi:hypothetical protein
VHERTGLFLRFSGGGVSFVVIFDRIVWIVAAIFLFVVFVVLLVTANNSGGGGGGGGKLCDFLCDLGSFCNLRFFFRLSLPANGGALCVLLSCVGALCDTPPNAAASCCSATSSNLWSSLLTL